MTIPNELEPVLGASDAPDGTLDIVPRKSGHFAATAEHLLNQDAAALRGARKRIVICADGTWNTPNQRDGAEPSPTNVWLFYQLVKQAAGDGMPQLAYYHTGVGTGGVLDRLRGGINGWGLRRNILDCYRFLIDVYEPGDFVYLFGFSRGAYTVRSLAGLIRNAGIIDGAKYPDPASRERAVGDAWSLYRDRGDDTSPVAQRSVDFRFEHSHPSFRLTCIGVWDTVGALGIPVNGLLGALSRHLFGFHDVTLSSQVDVALHAIAVDERRGPFAPSLWQQQPDAAAQGQKMEQVWFPGVHSDVGGGYAWSERELANVTLRWMVNRVSVLTGLELDVGALARAARDGTPPSAIVLHDSLSWYYRLPPLTNPVVRVIDGGLGVHGLRGSGRRTTERLHASVDWCRATYATTPLPEKNLPYAPPNVMDYQQRVEASLTATPVAPRSSSDVRRA